jgi:hypothetical protein
MARTSANYIGPFSTNSLLSMDLSDAEDDKQRAEICRFSDQLSQNRFSKSWHTF